MFGLSEVPDRSSWAAYVTRVSVCVSAKQVSAARPAREAMGRAAVILPAAIGETNKATSSVDAAVDNAAEGRI